jgi:hypothetical protein
MIQVLTYAMVWSGFGGGEDVDPNCIYRGGVEEAWHLCAYCQLQPHEHLAPCGWKITILHVTSKVKLVLQASPRIEECLNSDTSCATTMRTCAEEDWWMSYLRNTGDGESCLTLLLYYTYSKSIQPQSRSLKLHTTGQRSTYHYLRANYNM